MADSSAAQAYVNSPHFRRLAELLKLDSAQTVEFINEVHRLVGRGKLANILACVETYTATTPEKVAEHLVQIQPARRGLPTSAPRTARPPASRKARRKALRSVASRPRYVWNPDTGSIEFAPDEA